MPVLLHSSGALYVHIYNVIANYFYTQIRELRAQSIYTSEPTTPLYVLCCGIR